MIHTFEFVVVKHQTQEDIDAKKEPEVINLIYKSESSRKSKVAEKIRTALDKSNMVKRENIKDLYLREV